MAASLRRQRIESKTRGNAPCQNDAGFFILFF